MKRGDDVLAIVKMSKVKIVVLKNQFENVLIRLQRLNLVQIEKTESENHIDNQNKISNLDKSIDMTLKAAEILKSDFVPERESGICNTKQAAKKILSARENIARLKEQNKKYAETLLMLSHYKTLDMSITYDESSLFTFRTGFISGSYSEDTLNTLYENIYFEVLSTEKDKTYVWAVCKKEHAGEFSGIDFTELDITTPLTPKEYIENINSKIKQNNILISTHKKTIDSFRGFAHLFSLQPLLSKKERLEASQKAAITENTAIISGYIPKKLQNKLKDALPECYIEFSPADDKAPVMFKNGFFASPVEDITATYSMPSKTDVDPNPVMAFFYYLFFGMMFSDAGYGIVMIAVCGYLGYVKKSKNFKMMQMFFFCGLSTLFWGLMYGSFFGNLFASVAETFFGRRVILRPLWIDPTGEPLTLLIFSIALGFIQIITGLIIKLYSQARLGKIKEGILDTLSWIIALTGLGLTAAAIAAPQLKNIGFTLLILGAAFLILTQGRHKKNPVIKLFSGLLSLYNVTSYISDILSYSRLMALGLATGVIAQVVNILGSLGGRSVVGIIMYILIFAVGHSMNFAINMLGAYVHTNRLQYVEFYSKFYEGGGRKFIPFGKKYIS